MATITLKGNETHTTGNLPEVGSQAPSSTLVTGKLEDRSLGFGDRSVILNIFPSVDTGVCATSVRTFNERAVALKDVVVVNVSNDLPFALNRFCGAEGIENAETMSAFRTDFGDTYGLTIADGPMRGLLARAVVVVDGAGKVLHTELVPEIAQEPDYDAAIDAVQS